MSVEGEKFVKEEREAEEELFCKYLIQLSQMVTDGKLNSTGAKQVYSELAKQHEVRLSAIDILGEMIE